MHIDYENFPCNFFQAKNDFYQVKCLHDIFEKFLDADKSNMIEYEFLKKVYRKYFRTN